MSRGSTGRPVTRRKFIALTGATAGAAVGALLLTEGYALAEVARADSEVQLGEQHLRFTLIDSGAPVALRQLANRATPRLGGAGIANWTERS